MSRPSLALGTSILLLSTPAAADDVILYDGLQADAVPAAQKALPDLAADAELLTPAQLAERLPPRLAGPGRLELCDGGPLPADALAEAGRKAAGHVAYFEYGPAAEALDSVLDRIACLDQVIDPDEAARAWFLRGFVAHEQGQSDLARAAFRQALIFHPALAWNPDYPETGTALLEEARTAMSEARPLALAPPDGSRTVHLDGRSVDPATALHLAPGTHLLQVEGDPPLGILVEAGVGADALLVPGLVSDGIVHDADRRDGRARIEAALGPALGERDRLVVVSGSTVWLRQSDGTWTEPSATEPSDAEPSTTGPAPATSAPQEARPVSGPGPALTWSGVGLVVAGGGLAVTGQVLGRAAVRDADAAPDGATWDDAAGRYDTASLLLPIGYAVAGAGAASAGLGLLLDAASLPSPAGVRLGPLLGPGTGGLQLEVRR